MILLHILCLFIFISCSSKIANESRSSQLSFYKKKYLYQDKSGDFNLIRQSGLDKDKKLVTKYRLSQESKISEQSIVFSDVGKLSGKLLVLKPHHSEYSVWFEGKRYQTKMKVLSESKSLEIITQSPESQWNFKKKIPFPKGNGVYCFFTQLIECAKRIGFLQKALKSKSGSMSLTLIFDGYPYIQEQYSGLDNKPFATATLKYDSKTAQGDERFALSLRNNMIFYFVDKNFHFEKMFWPAQGLSIFVNR